MLALLAAVEFREQIFSFRAVHFSGRPSFPESMGGARGKCWFSLQLYTFNEVSGVAGFSHICPSMHCNLWWLLAPKMLRYSNGN